MVKNKSILLSFSKLALYLGVFLVAGFLFFTSAEHAKAVDSNCIAAGEGNWSTITWTNCTGNPGGDPDSDDTVTIPDSSTRTVTLDVDTTIGNLVICDTGCATPDTGGMLVHNSGADLIINGTATVHGGSGANDTSRWNINAGTATIGGLLTLDAQSTSSGRDAQINVTTGTLTANGGVNFVDDADNDATQLITVTSGTITIAGSFNYDCGTITNQTSAGIIEFTGAVTWGHAAACTPVLTTIASTTVKFGGSLNVANDNLTSFNATSTAEITGTSTITHTANIVFGNFKISSGTTTLTGAGSFTVAGDLTNNSTITYSGTPTMTLSGVTKLVTTTGGSPSTTFYNLTIAPDASYTVGIDYTIANNLVFTAPGANQNSSWQDNSSSVDGVIEGTVTLNQATSTTGTPTVTWGIKGVSTVTGLISFPGTGTTGRVAQISLFDTNSVLNANGGIDFTGGTAPSTKVLDFTWGGSSPTLNLKGSLTAASTAATIAVTGGSSATFCYCDTTAAQTVNFFASGAYMDLKILNTNSSGATLGAAITSSNVNGHVTVGNDSVAAIFSNGGFAQTLAADKNFVVNNNATFKMNGSAENLPAVSGSGARTYDSNSTVEYIQTTSLTLTSGQTFGNLSFKPASGTPTYTLPASITVNGNFTVGGGAAVAVVTAATNDPTFTVSGNFTVDAGDTFIASDSATLTLAGTTFTNDGTFTSTGSTVAASGTSTLTFTTTNSTATSFNNFSVTGIGGAKTIKFKNGIVYTFTGTVTLNGASGQILTIDSSDGANQWLAHFNSAVSPTWVSVSNSGCDTGTANATVDGNSTLVTNNGTCWMQDSLTISGKIYTDYGLTQYLCATNGNLTIKAVVNSGTPVQATCTVDSGVSFTLPAFTGIVTGDAIHVFVDTSTPTKRGSTVHKILGNNGSTWTIDIYLETLAVSNGVGVDPVTNSTTKGLGSYDADDNANIIYTANSNNLNMTAGSLLIRSGSTYTPGGTVTTASTSTSASKDGDVLIHGTLNMGSNSLSVGGDFTNTNTFSVSAPQTTTFTATSTGFTINDGSNNFDIMTFNGSGGEWTMQSSSEPTGNVTITLGTLKLGSTTLTIASAKQIIIANSASAILHGGSGTLTLNGSGSGASRPFLKNTSGVFTASNGTVDYKGTAATDIETVNYGTLKLGATSDSTSVTYTLNGDISVSGTLTIGNASDSATPDTFDISSRTLTLSGSGTPLNMTAGGLMTVTGSTVNYTATSATNITATTYNNLSFTPTSAATYTLPNSNITLRGDLSIGSNTTVTKGSGTMIFAKGGGGTQTWTNSGTVDDIGAVQVSANSGVTTLSTSSSVSATSITVDTSQNLDIASDTLTLTGSGTAFTLAGSNTFTVTSSTVNYTYTAASPVGVTVGAATYNNLGVGSVSSDTNPAVTYTLGGPTIANGTLTIGHASSTNSDILNTGTNYALDAGSLSITAKGTLTANNSTITLTGSTFTNNGTFTAGGSTVRATTTTTLTFTTTNSTSTTFNHFNISSIGGAKTIKFLHHTSDIPLYTFNGTLTLNGASGQLLTIDSDDSTNPWIAHFASTASPDYVSVSNSTCDGTSANLTPTNSIEGTGVGSCWGLTSANFTASVTGNWNSSATWGGGGVPGPNDNAFINAGITVTVTATATIKNLTFNNNSASSATLSVNSSQTLTVNQVMTVDGNLGADTLATVQDGTGAGTLTVGSVSMGRSGTTTSANSTTLTSTISNFNIGSSGLSTTCQTAGTGTKKNTLIVNLNTGTMSTSGLLSFCNGANPPQFNMNQGAQSGTLITTSTPSTFSYTNGNFTANLNGTSSTVNYAGANQTLMDTFKNLTLSGSGNVNSSAATTINGNLVMSTGSTLGWDTSSNTSVGGNATIGSGTSLVAGNAASTLSITGTTSVTGTIQNLGGLTKTYGGLVTVNSGGNFTTNGGTGQITFSNGVTVSSGGSFSLPANPPVSMGGDFTNNSASTINTGSGTFTWTATKQIAGSGGITFGGAVTLNSSVVVTNNNTGTVTVTGALDGVTTCACTWTQGASSYLVLANNGAVFATAGTLTATASSNTVEYSGGSSTVVKNTSYNNLKISGTLSTGTQTAIVAGTFTNSGTFTPSAGTITVNGGGAISKTGGTLTFLNLTTGSGTVTSSGSYGIANSGTMTINGTFTPAAADVITAGTTSTITGSGTVQVTRTTGQGTANFVTQYASFTTRTLTNLTVEFTESTQTPDNLTYGNAGSGGLKISAAITNSTTATVAGVLTTTAAFAPTAGTITMNTGSSIVTSGSAPTFFDLTIASGATVTTTSNFSIDGTLTNNSTGSFTASSPSVVTLVSATVSNSGTTLSFYGLTIGSGTTVANTNLTVTNALTVSGTLSPTSGTYTLSGSTFTNNGTFTASGSHIMSLTTSATVTLSGSAAATTFQDFSATGVGAAKTVNFKHQTANAPIFTFAGTVTLNGASGQILTINSDDGTNQWLAHFNNPVSPTWVSVSNSGCDAGTADATVDGNSTLGANNGTCWKLPGVTISGTLYQNDGTTVIDCSGGGANTRTVAISVNGGTPVTTNCTTSDGTFTRSVQGLSQNAVVTIFFDGETEKGATVTKAKDNTTAIITTYVYTNRLTIRTEDTAAAMTNTNLNVYDANSGACAGGTGDSDIPFCTDGTDLTLLDGFGLILFDIASTTTSFTPGGIVTTSVSSDGTDSVADGDITITAGSTLTMGTNALSVGGDFTNSGTFSYSAGQTTTFTATATGFTIEDGTNNFDTLNFNGSGGEWTLQSALNPADNTTVTAGTLVTGSSITGASGKTFQVNNGATFRLTGTGTYPTGFTTYTFQPTSTMQYQGNSITVTAATYGNLTLGGTNTYTLPASDITLRGNLVVTTGATVTKSASNKLIFAIGGGVTQTITGNATNSDLGILQVSANTGNSTLSSSSAFKATSITVDASQNLDITSDTLTLTGTSTALTLSGSNTFTITGSTVQYTGTTATVTGTTFNHLTLGGTGTYTLPAADITLRGNLAVTASANVTKSASNKIIFAIGGGGTQTLTDSSGNAPDLGKLQVSANSGVTTLSTSSSIKATSITVDASQNLNIDSDTVTLTGNGTPFNLSGSNTFTVTGSTFNYADAFNGFAEVNVMNTTYNNLGIGTVVDTDSGDEYPLLGNIVVQGTLTIGNASSTTSDTFWTNIGNYDITASAVNITSKGIFTIGGNFILTGTGTPLTVSGTFNAAVPSTVQYTATTATVTGTTFNNLTLGGTGTYTLPAADVTLWGNLVIPSSANVTKSASNKIIFAKQNGGTQTITDSSGNAPDLGILQVSANGGTTTLSSSSSFKATSIIVDASQNLNIDSDTLTLTGTSTPLTLSGSNTFTTTGSTVDYIGNGATVTCTGASYNNLGLKPSSTSVQTICTGASQTLTVGGALTIGDTTNQGATAATNNPIINVTGATTIAAGATMTTGTGAWTQTGNLTVTGTLSGTANGTIAAAGDVTGTGTVNLTSAGTFEQRVGANQAFGPTGANDWNFVNLTFGRSAGTPTITTQTSGTGNVAISGTLNVGKVGDAAATILNPGDIIWTLSANGTPLVFNASSSICNVTCDPLALNTSTFNYTYTAGAGSITVTPAGYYNLGVGTTSDANAASTFALSAATTATGTVTIGHASSTNSDTLNTNAFDLNTGPLAITSKGVLLGSSGKTITIGGDWTNNGTFTHNSGTVAISPVTNSATVNITGTQNSSFHNFTANSASAGNMDLKVKAGNTLSVANNLNLGGSVEKGSILLQSDSAGNQWTIYVDPSASVTLDHVAVKDSACGVGTKTFGPSVVLYNGGNNGSCWSFFLRGIPSNFGQIHEGGTGGGGSAQCGAVCAGGGGGSSGGGEGGSGGGGGTLPQAFTAADATALTTYDSNWSLSSGNFAINTNALHSNTAATDTMARWTVGSFNDNQYAEITIVASGSGYIGAGVRLQSGAHSGYGVYCNGTDVKIIEWNAGTPTTHYTGSACSTSDVVRLEISSTTLTLKRNGSTVTTVADSTYSTGRPGLVGNGNSNTTRGDDFYAGSITGGGGGGGGGGP